MTVADSIAEFFAVKGIGHAFGIIGAGNAALFDAIARRGATEIVCCHHEAAAVMAATYYGRYRGGVGVALVTTGAGSSNAITGALAAFMDYAPVLILSGNEPSKYLAMEPERVVGVQGFRTARAVAPFVKWSVQAGEPLFKPALTVEHGYTAALDGIPGPVWVDIPRDLFNAEAS